MFSFCIVFFYWNIKMYVRDNRNFARFCQDSEAHMRRKLRENNKIYNTAIKIKEKMCLLRQFQTQNLCIGRWSTSPDNSFFLGIKTDIPKKRVIRGDSIKGSAMMQRVEIHYFGHRRLLLLLVGTGTGPLLLIIVTNSL